MAKVEIMYGRKSYKMNASTNILPYLIDTISLSDEQIQKDMEIVNNDEKMEIKLLHIAVILNNINWVKKLLELNHKFTFINKGNNIYTYSPLYYALDNTDKKISFEIAKLIIEKNRLELFNNSNISNHPYDYFYLKKQNSENWIYMFDKVKLDEIAYQYGRHFYYINEIEDLNEKLGDNKVLQNRIKRLIKSHIDSDKYSVNYWNQYTENSIILNIIKEIYDEYEKTEKVGNIPEEIISDNTQSDLNKKYADLLIEYSKLKEENDKLKTDADKYQQLQKLFK